MTEPSLIDPHLWMGGIHMPGFEIPAPVLHVVSLHVPENLGSVFLKSHHIWPIEDGQEIPDPGMIVALAFHINACREQGEDVLVHCSAGINRSGLLCAAALVLDGHDPQAAINKIRAARSPQCLSNRAFEGWILNLKNLLAKERLDA